jgi:methylase of polypeptide subunit release factors
MSRSKSLQTLLSRLAGAGYAFTTPTPSTCRRKVEKPTPGPRSLRDIFGWTLGFAQSDLEPDLLALMQDSDCVIPDPAGWRATVRISTVHGRLFLHSAFPANQPDAVFLGPDSYRFADLIAAEIGQQPIRTIFDVGAGAGVGGLTAQQHASGARVYLGDINPLALELAAANAARAGVDAEIIQASGLDGAPDDLDLIVANPPYVAGDSGRAYKDGGDLHGARLSLDWAVAGMGRLAPGGRIILYTGSAILDGGVDQFQEALKPAVEGAGCLLRYRELDPDIFSGELRRAAYADVERIAAVGAVITRPS